MIYRSRKPSLQCGLALAGGAHDGSGGPSIARLGCTLLDKAAITESIERSIHQGSMHRKDPPKVRACLELPSNGETVRRLLADKSQHDPLGQGEFRSAHGLKLAHGAN